eukprot:6172337-Pleurochrysis_carterae.AAC.1
MSRHVARLEREGDRGNGVPGERVTVTAAVATADGHTDDESGGPAAADPSEPLEGHELDAEGVGEAADSDGTDATNDDLIALKVPAPPEREEVMEWWYVQLCRTPEIGHSSASVIPPATHYSHCWTPGRPRLDLRDVHAVYGTLRVRG